MKEERGETSLISCISVKRKDRTVLQRCGGRVGKKKLCKVAITTSSSTWKAIQYKCIPSKALHLGAELKGGSTFHHNSKAVVAAPMRQAGIAVLLCPFKSSTFS